ncbi:MAG: SufD family Fe-S cluster assembly protein [bacterium]
MKIKENKTHQSWEVIDQPKDSAKVFSLEPNSSLEYLFIILGSSGQYSIKADLGKRAQARIHGLFIGQAQDFINLKVETEHSGLNSQAQVKIHGLLTDQARANFQGRVHIPKEGNQSNAFLEERVLVLSNQARSESLPSLEIEAKDVKAGHAATTGTLDELNMFYLTSRGLPNSQAASMLIKGFLISAIPSNIIKDHPQIEQQIESYIDSIKMPNNT